MPLGNPIRKQNESRIISVLATEGQSVFTVEGGYIINHISVFRNGVRLSNSEDFTAGDGSTVTLNNEANVDDRIEFHIFDRFTVQNAIVGAASTQTINGDLVLNGKLFGQLDVPSINLTGIITATELDLNGKGDISSDLTVTRHLSVGGISTFTGAIDANGDLDVDGLVSIATSIVHTGDTNTSIGFSAADAIDLRTGGIERLRIQSDKVQFSVHAKVDNHNVRDLGTSANRWRSLYLGTDLNVAGVSTFANAVISGVCTATTFSGSGASLTNLNGSNIASGTVPTARLGSGTASSSTFLRGDSTFQTVNTDLVSDTSPQLGGNLASNGNNINIADSTDGSTNRVTFGSGGDLQVFHDSSDSFFINGTGQLIFRTASVKSAIVCKPDAAVELYHNNSLRFETTSGGCKSSKADANTFTIGSSNAGGAYLVLDGDSNGDGSGGDYAYLEHSTGGDLNIIATNPNDDAVMHFHSGDGSRRMTLSSARDLLSIGTTSDECPAWSSDRAGIKMQSNQPVLYMVDSQDTSGDDGYLGRAGATTYLASKGGSVIIQTSASGSGTTSRVTVDQDGAVTCASAKASAHTQFYSYSTGGNYEQTFRISNASTGSSANMRLLIGTYANQGADPYIKFDSGGTNFVVGQRWAGTSSNALVLGRGEDASSMDAQVLIRGDGDFYVGSNGSSVSSTSGFYVNASGNAASSTDNGYLDHRRRVGSGNNIAVHRGTQGRLQIHGDGDCENTNNNYSGISDVSLKENIVDASSQWNDIKAVKVRKFNFKSETGFSTDTRIGVVAQELESVSPNLVKEVRKDSDPKATDTSTIKSVKYSILYMKGIKALQEAMTRIETLEAKVAALEGS